MVSVDDICVVERISHCITLHKPLARISDQPKEGMDYPMQQQQQPPKDIGRSDSERSLIEEGAPVCSSDDHQPLHPDKEPEAARQPDKVQDMETAHDYDKAAATAATVKKQILEEANKSVCVCVSLCVTVCHCVCVTVCVTLCLYVCMYMYVRIYSGLSPHNFSM